MNRVALLVVLVLASFVPAVCAQMSVQASGTLVANMVLNGYNQSYTVNVSGSGNWPGYGALSTSLGQTTTLHASAFRYSFAFSADATVHVRLLYSANGPLAGRLRFLGTPGPTTSFVRVDVDGDGLRELSVANGQGPMVVEVPVVLGPRAIAVDVDMFASTGSSQSATSDLAVEFLPETNLVTDGLPCGPGLEATLLAPTATTAGRMFLHVADALVPTGDIAAILVGSTPLPMGATCGQGLLDDALVLVAPVPGGINVPVPLSTGLVGTVYLQYVALTLPSQLSWSNRIGLSLP